jgi:phosphoribosylanthranilate isomerase
LDFPPGRALRNVVKICGLREREHAAAAAAAGADLVGFIFAPARRRITAGVARMCVEAARAERNDVIAVGVFVDAPLTEILATVEQARLDAVQLNGNEPPRFIEELPVPAIKAFRTRAGASSVEIVDEMKAFLALSRPPVGFLIDGYAEGKSGGVGIRADWGLAAEIGASHPFMLAGGLNPENVGEAIRRAVPVGVDVSSGVEIDGVKSAALIEEFIRQARLAFAQVA